MRERYKPEEVISNTDGAIIKNFIPEKDGKDRFGNRLMTSDQFSYFDGVGDKIRSGILISPEGQRFIMENNGILRDIEHGLVVCGGEDGSLPFGETVFLGNDRTLRAVANGSQSIFYVLKINDKKFAIKTHSSGFYHQPYINEMLQTQEISEYFRIQHPEIKVRFSNFLFASGQISCAEFEEKDGDFGVIDNRTIAEIQFVANFFLNQKKIYSLDELWDNLEIDLPQDRMGALLAIARNFIPKKDGYLIWIDPFIYKKPEVSK